MSKPIKILHTADWHLRSSQYARLDRGNDFTAAAHKVVAIGIEQKVDVIVNPGDVLNSNHPGSLQIGALKTIHQQLLDAGLPMLITTGNHDMSDPPWIEQIRGIKDDPSAGIIPLDNKSWTHAETGVVIAGLPFLMTSELQAKAAWPDADILLWHGMLKEFIDFPDPGAVSMADFPLDKYVAVLVGDLHLRAYKTHGRTLFGYPSSTELCEKGEPLNKSVELLTYAKGGEIAHHAIPLPTRTALVYHITTEEDMDRILPELHARRHENPMVFYQFNPRLESVVTRIKSQLTDQAIIRGLPIADGLDVLAASCPGQAPQEKPPQEFLSIFIPPGTPLFDVAKRLIQKDADVDSVLEEFMAARSADIEQQVINANT